jgi:RNA polymerase sigma-70 factor (ECF subfamily)
MTDVEGLERTYRATAPRLWRALVAYSGDPDIASDAVAEAFAQALRRGENVRDPERWVWKAALRIAAGELKDRGRRDEPEREPTYEMPDEAIEMWSVLRQLSSKQRAAVVLHYYADLPDRRIAEILGIGTATVRVHLTRGRRHLKRLLEDADA